MTTQLSYMIDLRLMCIAYLCKNVILTFPRLCMSWLCCVRHVCGWVPCVWMELSFCGVRETHTNAPRSMWCRLCVTVSAFRQWVRLGCLSLFKLSIICVGRVYQWYLFTYKVEYEQFICLYDIYNVLLWMIIYV